MENQNKGPGNLIRGLIKFWDSRARRGVIRSDAGQEFYVTETSLLDRTWRPQAGKIVLFRRNTRSQIPAGCQVVEAA